MHCQGRLASRVVTPNPVTLVLTRGLRILHALAVLAALIAGVSGCSKNSTAPQTTPQATPAPTKFSVFASDRNRLAGVFHNYVTGLDVPGTYAFTFGTGTAIVDRHPSISEDGHLFVYQSSPGRGGSQDVFMFNRATGVFTDDPSVNTNANETDPYLSLNGRRLAFVREILGVKRIQLYDTQTRTFIGLPGIEGSASSNDWAPALDEQGLRLAFVSDRNGNPDVFVYRVSTHALSAYAPLASASDDIEPSISGSGRYVAFASDRTGGLGGYDLYLFDLTTQLLVAVPGNSVASDRDPSISFDGSHLQFASDRAGGLGGMDVWLLDLAAGTVQAVSGQNSSAADVDPVIVWR
jgi:Tol biopolymer transport system component